VQFKIYCFSFFWWMELAANVSMVFGLGALTVVTDECFDSVDIGAAFSTAFAQGARLARVMRLLRVIRVIRVFATCQKQRNPQSKIQKNQQSAIGKRVNEVLVRSMIIIVIALQTIFPFLTFDEDDTARSLVFGMVTLGANYSNFNDQLADYRFQGENYDDANFGDPEWSCKSAAAPDACSSVSNSYYELRYLKLLKTIVNGNAIVYGAEGEHITGPTADACLGSMTPPLYTFTSCPAHIASVRCGFLETVPWNARPDSPDAAFWDATQLAQRTAGLNIALTWLLIVVIITMYVLLSLDVTQMVVQPIESMVGLVRRLAENPTLQLEGQSKSKYETEAVRIALAKIVGLMQLGFGGAGHEIISYNLANSERTGLDLMLRGKKKECAYGFCDIRQFTDTVECLQDQVMLFTNSVGEIVHQSCHDNRGEPNKNIGDAFLIVWRPRTLGEHTKIVDGALTAFRRCVREIASSQTLQLVTNVEAIHKKFGRGKYRTKLGFGLHFGWSVEGPVGSPTKIDCSYLSPEVKISDRLEAATKIYSSNILMSGQFYDLLSDHIKVGIRLIDHVTLKGGVKPFRIYADDRSNLWLRMNPKLVDIYGAEAAYEQFSKTFHEGVDAFIKGDWPTAQQKLEGAHDFCPKDAPTMLLMREMKKRSIDPNTPTAPVDWKGYHDSDV